MTLPFSISSMFPQVKDPKKTEVKKNRKDNPNPTIKNTKMFILTQFFIQNVPLLINQTILINAINSHEVKFIWVVHEPSTLWIRNNLIIK